jgi:tRNA dimethylallyltransferase
LRWAERNEAEIVSCDSLLFYRGMDIGTAKPTPAERARVRHHIIDICAITERMDVTRYVARAQMAIGEIHARGRNVLVTGGSGFYLKSFFSAVADEVDVPAAVREQVARLSLPAAVEQLRRLNPSGPGAIDLANPRRVSRALERCLASGRPLSELAENFARQRSPFAGFEVRLTQLERTPEMLEARIEARVQAMLREGLVDEVRRLRDAGLERNSSAARAIGYREVLALLDGRIVEQALAAEIAKNTRALVKKQRTWFRTQLPPHRVVSAETLSDVSGLFESGSAT